MAQATSTLAPHASLGRAYAEFFTTMQNLTDQQTDALDAAGRQTDGPHHEQALQCLAQAMELLNNSHIDLTGRPHVVVDAGRAVIARDRGLLCTLDFTVLTTAWTNAGLPLPTTITGDDLPELHAPLSQMTSDRLADLLLQAAFPDDPSYGAVLMLTGYNHGELLAYPQMRVFLDLHDGRLKADWTGLRTALDGGALTELTDDARQAVRFALDLEPEPGPFDFDEDTAETMVVAFAYAIGAEAILNPAAVPQPRDGRDPGTP